MKAQDEYFSREHRFSLGRDQDSGVRYVSIPVTIGIADYEEYYRLTDEEYQRFLAAPSAALPFVEECRRREHDTLLLVEPPANRGVGS